MKYKRGISIIVSVILFIFLSLIIAGIIWNSSNSFVKKQKAETEGFSFYYDAKLYLISENSDVLLLGVKRIDNEGNITGVRFIFEEGGSSYSYENYSHPPNAPGITETYPVNVTKIGISDVSKIKKISVSLLYGDKKSTDVLNQIEI